MKFSAPRLAILVLLFSATLSAQKQTHTTTIPEFFTGVNGTGINWLPMGRTRTFIQTWYRGDSFKLMKPLWFEMGWRISPRVTSAPATAHKMEIILSNTSKGFSNLSKTFSQNLAAGSKTTVFVKMKTINFPAITKVQTNPEVPAVWIKGDRPFLYSGPNLIVQVDVQTMSTYASINRYQADAYSMGSSATGSIHRTVDKSCGGTLSASFVSPTLSLNLVGGANTGFAVFVIGIHRLPVDVGFLFGQNCTWVVDPILLFPTTLSSGAASLSGPIGPQANTLLLYAQAFHTIAGGIGTSNATHSLIGGKGLSTYLYNWTRDGLIAQSGPFSSNRGAIILVR